MRRTSDHTPRSQCKRYHPKIQPFIIIGQILLKTRLNNQYSIFIGRQTHSPSTTTPTSRTVSNQRCAKRKSHRRQARGPILLWSHGFVLSKHLRKPFAYSQLLAVTLRILRKIVVGKNYLEFLKAAVLGSVLPRLSNELSRECLPWREFSINGPTISVVCMLRQLKVMCYINKGSL